MNDRVRTLSVPPDNNDTAREQLIVDLRELNRLKSAESRISNDKRQLNTSVMERMLLGKEHGVWVDGRLHYKTTGSNRNLSVANATGDAVDDILNMLPTVVENPNTRKSVAAAITAHREAMKEAIVSAITQYISVKDYEQIRSTKDAK